MAGRRPYPRSAIRKYILVIALAGVQGAASAWRWGTRQSSDAPPLLRVDSSALPGAWSFAVQSSGDGVKRSHRQSQRLRQPEETTYDEQRATDKSATKHSRWCFRHKSGILNSMNRGALVVAIGALGVASSIGSARALVSDAPENPYLGITNRNVFGLRQPIKAPPIDPQLAALPRIKLTGITTILGKKQALLLVEVPARPQSPARDDSCILTEGQSDGEIEMIAIDDKEGTVKVKNHCTLQTLDFVNNGVKLPAGSAPPPPGVLGGVPPPGMTVPAMRQIPQLPQRAYADNESTQPAITPQVSSQMMSGAINSGSVNSTAGTMGLSFGGGQNGNTTTPPNFGLTGDEQSVLIEAQRAKLMESGDAESAAMLPATELTPSQGQSLLTQ